MSDYVEIVKPSEFSFINTNSRLIYRSDTLTQSSGSVSSWTDLSGGSQHAVQATSGQQPAYIANDGGTPSVSFGGVNDMLQVTTPAGYFFGGGKTELTYANVYQLNTTVNQRLFSITNAGGPINRFDVQVLTGNITLDIYGNVTLERITLASADTSRRVLTITAERTGIGVGTPNYQHTINVWLDGTQILTNYVTASLGSDLSPTLVTIGAIQTTITTGYMNGVHKEIDFWNKAYNGSIINTINNTLISEYM